MESSPSPIANMVRSTPSHEDVIDVALSDIESSRDYHPAISQHGSVKFLAPNEQVEIHRDLEGIFALHQDDIRSMLESIERDGLQQPIILLVEDGHRWIVDGQTRRVAQQIRNELCPYTEITKQQLRGRSVLEFAIARNLASKSGRKMSDSQRAIIAGRLVKKFATICAENSRSGKRLSPNDRGTANERAAAALGVKPNRVRQALKVLPFQLLVDAVWAGELAISRAAQIAQFNPADHVEALRAAGAVQPARGCARVEVRKKASASQMHATRDATGREVPSTLRHIFRSIPSFRKQIQHLESLETWLAQLRGTDAGRMLLVPSGAIADLRGAIKAAMPHVVCTDWDKHRPRENCPMCRNTGWLTASELEAIRTRNEEESTDIVVLKRGKR